MNPIREDHATDRCRADSDSAPPPLVFGVMKKFGDDNAGNLVSNFAYSAFLSVFPLLLILITVPQHRAGQLRRPSAIHYSNSTLGEFPVVGTTLRPQHPRAASELGDRTGRRSARLTVGGQPGWHSPACSPCPRSGICPVRTPKITSRRLGRSFGFSPYSGWGSSSRRDWPLRDLRTPRDRPGHPGRSPGRGRQHRHLLRGLPGPHPQGGAEPQTHPGAILGGVLWTVLLAVVELIGHDLKNDSVTYGVFAAVLGLVAGSSWVPSSPSTPPDQLRAGTRLWPRGMVQPPLTEADQRSLALQATQNQRRPEQEVSVSFSVPRCPNANGPPGELRQDGRRNSHAARPERSRETVQRVPPTRPRRRAIERAARVREEQCRPRPMSNSQSMPRHRKRVHRAANGWAISFTGEEPFRAKNSRSALTPWWRRAWTLTARRLVTATWKTRLLAAGYGISPWDERPPAALEGWTLPALDASRHGDPGTKRLRR